MLNLLRPIGKDKKIIVMADRNRRRNRSSKREKKEKKSLFELTGKVQMTREGFIFVIVEGEENDVFVKASKTRGALNGDIVKVAVTKEKTETQRREGVVTEIVERSRRPFVGILHIVGDQAWVLMESRVMPYDIVIPVIGAAPVGYRNRKRKMAMPENPEELPDRTGCLKKTGDKEFSVIGVYDTVDGVRREMQARSGMKVAAAVDHWEKNESAPVGHLVDVLGEPGENDTEMHAILAEYALPYRFEPEVENAADGISDNITDADRKGRRDFRGVTTFTIDPADAKDFDDALSFRKLDNGNFEVGVHIADVTYYVKPGSIVDEEARARGTSVYLVDRTVPMLPEKLSNKLCSLRPNEEKLCFSAVFELTPLAKIVSQWFGRTEIESDYRFAYENAQEIIEAGKKAMTSDYAFGPQGQTRPVPDSVKEAVLTLYSLASKLRKKRFAAGAISFERPEMKVMVDEKGRPVDVCQKISKEANWLIEEFMLLANRSVAEFVATKCKTPAGKGRRTEAKTFVYRIHDEPNQEKLQNLRNFVGNFGYTLGQMNNGREISKELNGLFAMAKDKPEFNAIELLSLRTMAKARYSTDNIGHYGLAFKYYTHFTSPIRRYPDMMVHRLLAMYMDGAASQKKDYYEGLCKYASEREVVAAEAERSSIKYKLVEFMQDKVGYEFEGHISGLTEWGMYVEIEPTKIEGMVALRDIRSDFYEFDEEKYRIVGRSSRMVYNLGDPVKIRVKKTNLEQKLLDYELVETGLEERLPERESSETETARAARKSARKQKISDAIKASKKKKRMSRK